ncbi:hypothetical protein ACIBI9_20215 [Nonomuraea sp. NPDC050451]
MARRHNPLFDTDMRVEHCANAAEHDEAVATPPNSPGGFHDHP